MSYPEAWAVALHPEGVDRNASQIWSEGDTIAQSPSTRRAWIEMYRIVIFSIWLFVALHPEGVDRNSFWRVESDDNIVIVALHPEGVDRNGTTGAGVGEKSESPSTRRAWIEIPRG